MSKEKQIDVIIDLLTEFDEMGFAPTTSVPDPDAYAIEWRNQLTNALKGYLEQEWISVDERLPMYGELVLVSSMDKITKKHGWFYLASYDEERKWWNGASFGRVTHWMPLPEPPKGE